MQASNVPVKPRLGRPRWLDLFARRAQSVYRSCNQDCIGRMANVLLDVVAFSYRLATRTRKRFGSIATECQPECEPLRILKRSQA